MQKLDRRNTYTPTDAPQVRSNCGNVVKQSYEVGSVPHNLKTLSNNSDVDQLQHTGGLKAMVYVLNKNRKPLMPCKPAKARHLLKLKKAKVVKRNPFTIQLLWNCEKNTHPVKLGIDAGYSFIGFSATTENGELIAGEVIMLKGMKGRIESKRNYRHDRRNKLWHRPARFLNRGKENWLAPSIGHKMDTHIRLVKTIKKLLPVTNIMVEVANFDQQKMMNPEISGIEYQQGTLQGYEIREYLLDKWKRKCAYCKKKNIKLEVEHIVPKSRGGSSRISNLTLSCHKCNQKKGQKTAEEFGYPRIQKQAQKPLKATTFMNIVRLKIVDKLGCEWTYGYMTKCNRIKNSLEKSHINDAFIISGGTSQKRVKQSEVKQVRRNNRKLQVNRKGFRPSIRRQRYKLQPNDLVKFDNNFCRVKGVHNYGKRVVLDNENSVNIKSVGLVTYGKGLCFM